MTPHVLTRQTLIKEDIEKVFNFFSRAENLNKITPPAMGFKLLSNHLIKIQKGSIIDYRISVNGIPFKWRTEITGWKPPYFFEDTQVKGPYKMWVHQHTFESKDNFTLMNDTVNYRSPGGIFEFIPHYLFVRKKVESIFDFREKSLKEIFE